MPKPYQRITAPLAAEADADIYLFNGPINRGHHLAVIENIKQREMASGFLSENLLLIVPSERITSMNPCRVCHARLLAEHFESPPIYWPHCPYVAFQDEQ